ncbi:MAG: endonuclease III [Candidatus Diapherotrites archaeon]|nr:endonuclease III [Candidatus Diapherotrites archaeon]
MIRWEDLRPLLEEFYQREFPDHVKEEPWKVAIGCILSQRTRDEVTDAAYRRLLSRYPTLEDLASADPSEVEKLIYPVGFYRQKARRIVEAARYMLENGVKPSLEELLKIPGIGRKCANIVLAYGFGVPAIPVDTHVERVSKRLGIADPKDSPQRVEEKLRNLIPREMWIIVNHALVRFGREICRPVSPRCEICPLREICPSSRVKGSSHP